MNEDEMKREAANAAVEFVDDGVVVGVGTGSTVNYFIDAIAAIKHKIEGAVASSVATEQRLKKQGIRVFELNVVDRVPVYVDGTDEVNAHLQLIKGGGGALTREKIIAASAERFICIATQRKKVGILGAFPLPVEVIPMARSYVAREIVKLGGDPVYRQGVVTDNGNIILDVHNLSIMHPMALEQGLNDIVGVVTNGLFARRGADVLLLADASGRVQQFTV